jgi:hypothetical protein
MILIVATQAVDYEAVITTTQEIISLPIDTDGIYRPNVQTQVSRIYPIALMIEYVQTAGFVAQYNKFGMQTSSCDVVRLD